jgi:hypothetical protein
MGPLPDYNCVQQFRFIFTFSEVRFFRPPASISDGDGQALMRDASSPSKIADAERI